MELTGKIIAVMQPRSGVSQRTGNSWMMQDYVMEIPGQYPRHMVFNIFGEDRIKQFNIQQAQLLLLELLLRQLPLLSPLLHLRMLLLPSLQLRNRQERVVLTICPFRITF